MTKFYTNEVGKSKIEDADCKHQSKLRQQWFLSFESRLRNAHPDLMNEVEIQIVGSVAKSLASPESDIDIIIKSKSSDRLLIPRVRNAIYGLLDEMKKAGNQIYPIEIQEVGNPLMFNPVANFRREK